ncbi:MAG: FixH family protein, partial [Ignavibacteria bacterium]|nr:FixH family protein [Ignavibacteria bacterium]
VLMMQEDVNLVEKDYYPKGQAFQEQIIKKSNADNISALVQMDVKGDSLLIRFPEYFQADKINGSLHLYHREDESFDTSYNLEAINNTYFYFDISGIKGRYIAKIDWTYADTPYYIEKSLNID